MTAETLIDIALLLVFFVLVTGPLAVAEALESAPKVVRRWRRDDMSGISGPAVYSCPWCGRSVEQGESCWCKQSQGEAMSKAEEDKS